jgi:hypothetical protein
MSGQITIIPYGSLSGLTGLPPGRGLVHSIEGRQPLAQLLKAVGIPDDQVQLIMVNHRPAVLRSDIGPGDRVALFPREYPIFVDWQAFRQGGVSRDGRLS